MIRVFVLAVALLALPAFSQDAGSLDAGVVVPSPVVVPMSSLSLDAGVVHVDVQAEISMIRTVFTAVKTGNWWLAAGAFLVLVVSLLRSLGEKFHAWLPDNNILDKPLIFIYDTKIGGWVLNWLTAVAGGIGVAMAAGVTVDMSLWKSVVMVSTSATTLFELYSDLSEWWKTRKGATPPTPLAPTVAPMPSVPTPAPAPEVAPAPAPTEPPKS